MSCERGYVAHSQKEKRDAQYLIESWGELCCLFSGIPAWYKTVVVVCLNMFSLFLGFASAVKHGPE